MIPNQWKTLHHFTYIFAYFSIMFQTTGTKFRNSMQKQKIQLNYLDSVPRTALNPTPYKIWF